MISTKPPAGMRDFLPSDLEQRRYVLQTIEAVYRRHDFNPLETPVLERIEILTGKYGDEGDQLMFKVLKRGDKLVSALQGEPSPDDLADLGMRYDLTVPLCRVVAQYGSELPRIFKCFQMRPVWRADRPARGRFREFFQCDVDIVGTTSVVAEVDVITAAAEALEALGFEDFEVRINDRVILNAVVEAAGIPSTQHQAALVALDKLDKIGSDGVRAELSDVGLSGACVDALFGLLAPADSTEGGSRERLAKLKAALDVSAPAESFVRMDELLSLLAEMPATATRVAFEPSLARGLTYYTGAIFEIVLPGFSGSVGGGGRYDDLVGMFLGQQVPACGISLGVERLMMIMADRGMFTDRLESCDVFVTQFSGVSPTIGLRLAAELRRDGLSVNVYPEATKLKKQLALAEKTNAKIVVVIGPDEAEDDQVALKHMATKRQVTVPLDEAVEAVAELLAKAS